MGDGNKKGRGKVKSSLYGAYISLYIPGKVKKMAGMLDIFSRGRPWGKAAVQTRLDGRRRVLRFLAFLPFPAKLPERSYGAPPPALRSLLAYGEPATDRRCANTSFSGDSPQVKGISKGSAPIVHPGASQKV